MTFVAGEKIRASKLNSSGVLIARGRRTSSSPTTTTTTRTSAQRVIEVQAALVAGRAYLVSAPNVGCYSPAAGTCGLQLTYTTNGAAPTAGSAVLDYTQVQTPASSIVVPGSVGKVFIPGSNLTLRVVLSVWGVFAGTYGTYGAADWPTDLYIEDKGVAPADTGVDF